MTRGKEALQAANRRTAEATEAANALRAELTKVRADYAARTQELEAEVRRLKAEHLQEAGRLAAAEVARRLAQVEEERRKRGLSDDAVIGLVRQNDRLVRNACRYVSMTTGAAPASAMTVVFTWITGEDFYGAMDQDDWLIKHGFPLDGWTAFIWREFGKNYERVFTRKAIQTGKPEAISLDRAYAEGRAHKDYQPRWYGDVTAAADAALRSVVAGSPSRSGGGNSSEDQA